MRKLEDISDKTTPRHTAEERAGTARPAEAGLAMNAAIAVPVKARRVPCDLGYSTYLNAISFSSEARTVNEKDNEDIEAREPMDALAEPEIVFGRSRKSSINTSAASRKSLARSGQRAKFLWIWIWLFQSRPSDFYRSRDLNCIHVLIIPKQTKRCPEQRHRGVSIRSMRYLYGNVIP